MNNQMAEMIKSIMPVMVMGMTMGTVRPIMLQMSTGEGALSRARQKIESDKTAVEAQPLVKQALKLLEEKDAPLDSVLWRLVDAAGMLSEVVLPNAIGQKANPTGYGYYIGKTRIVPVVF